MNINVLPSEILGHIFDQVDDRTLRRCEKVCSRWRTAIAEGYQRKCKLVLRFSPELKHVFKRLNFDSFKDDSDMCKEFYYKLRWLDTNWSPKECKKEGRPFVYRHEVFDLDVTNVSNEWQANHNYTGIYDTVFLPDEELLVVSAFDQIQVWDTRDYKVIHTFLGQTLDFDKDNTSCYNICGGKSLVLGTITGKLKAFDLRSGAAIGSFEAKERSSMICDLNAQGSKIYSVDLRGYIAEFEWSRSSENEAGDKIVFQFIEEFLPPISDELSATDLRQRYTTRHVERRLECNDEILITNFAHGVVVLSLKNPKAAKWIRARSWEVLCVQVNRNFAYWGGHSGRIYRTQIDHDKNVITLQQEKEIGDKFRTRFRDNVTSLAVSDKRIVLGDTNGDVHLLEARDDCLNQDCFLHKFEDGCHKYRSYVWTVQMDATRIFSGDSASRLAVRDFWDDRCHRLNSNNDQDGEPSVKRRKRTKIQDGMIIYPDSDDDNDADNEDSHVSTGGQHLHLHPHHQPHSPEIPNWIQFPVSDSSDDDN